MLSLTPLALHSLHSIFSGGVSVSGGALDLLVLMCACANKGENFLEIKQGEFCLIFERTKKPVVHRTLRVHTCGESCTGEGEIHFSGSFCFV